MRAPFSFPLKNVVQSLYQASSSGTINMSQTFVVEQFTAEQYQAIYHALINQDPTFLQGVAQAAIVGSAQTMAEMAEDESMRELPDESDVKNMACDFMRDMLHDWMQSFEQTVRDTETQIKFVVSRKVDVDIVI